MISKLTSLVFILTMFVLSSCGGDEPSEKPQDNANNKKALTEIRKEEKIKEAFINDASVLYVSVEDDGTKRNGYANYLCEMLHEQNSTIKTIRVMKVGSINDPAADGPYGILLGETECK